MSEGKGRVTTYTTYTYVAESVILFEIRYFIRKKQRNITLHQLRRPIFFYFVQRSMSPSIRLKEVHRYTIDLSASLRIFSSL